MGQAAITEKQVEQFPDLSFKWLLELPDNLRAFLQIVCPDIVNQIDFTKVQKQGLRHLVCNLHELYNL